MVGKGMNLAGEVPLMQALTYIAIVIIFFGMINQKLTVGESKRIEVLILLGMFITFFCKKVTILLTLLLICCSKGISLKKVVQISFWIRLVMMCATVALSLSGKLADTQMYTTRDDVVYLRNGLGIGHPNTAQMLLFIVVCMYTYAYYEKFNWLSALCIFSANIWFYRYTFSRTGFILTFLLPIIVLIFRSNRGFFIKIKAIFIEFFTNSYWIMTVFSFGVSIAYKFSKIAQLLNHYISSRFGAGNYYLNEYPFSFFGTYIDDIGYPLDNSYVYTYVAFGAIILIIYIGYTTKLLKYYKREKREKEIIILGLFALYSISENSFTNILMNFSLFFFKDLLFTNQSTDLQKGIT